MVDGRWRAHSLAVSPKQWHQRHSVNGQTPLQLAQNSPDLNLIESLLSQLKQWQSQECATWMAELKRIALRSGGRSLYHTLCCSAEAC